jgi:hypothetical protein
MTTRRQYLAARRKEQKAQYGYVVPKPKFRIGDIVQDKDPDGRRVGTVSHVGGYQDNSKDGAGYEHMIGYTYKVFQMLSNGTVRRDTWSEWNMELVKAARPVRASRKYGTPGNV